jgi:asparagine synthase (glutamine-hydrolysing)
VCGIAGCFQPGGLRADDARGTAVAMAETLEHRGPDDSGVWLDAEAGIALAFRRLSIIDLTQAGHQPMESATGRYVVVFNGEIYNFPDLRHDLMARGVVFRGRSDTEVLLAAIETWGVRETLVKCNGMFACALWDREQRQLILARDRAGEKPLYYGWMGRTLLFGSELKALRAHPSFQAQIDRQALTEFLRYGYVPDPMSIYVGVKKLMPGTYLAIEHPSSNMAPTPYWSLCEVAEAGVAEPFRGTAREAIDNLEVLLKDAVRIRMEADVPLGAFLSGGVDSATIVSLMQAQSSTPVRTFTIGFDNEQHNEARHAAAVARHLGTTHTEVTLTPAEAMAVIPRLPHLYDEPFADTSQIPTFLVSELAKRHVTVSLSGDAGDELFGGYRRHRLGPSIWRAISWIPKPLRAAAAVALLAGAGPPGHVMTAVNRVTRQITGKRSFSERLGQSAEMVTAESPAALYDYMMSLWKHPTRLVRGTYENTRPSPNGRVLPQVGNVPEHIMMYLDSTTYLPSDILVKLDRASMGVSLESRVPLLDHRLIEFAWRLPLTMKLNHGTSKWLLRQVLYRYVPRQLVDRPKQGFHMPVTDWLRGPLRDWAESLLNENRLRSENLLEPGPIRQKWREHLSGESRWDYRLWTVLMFQSWQEASIQATLATAVA